MSRERSNHRKGYEFSRRTKREAKWQAGYACEICGDDECSLEVHHIVGIWYARNYHPDLSATVIKSLANAQALCSDCHAEVHLADNEFDKMDEYAHHLKLMQPKTFARDSDEGLIFSVGD